MFKKLCLTIIATLTVLSGICAIHSVSSLMSSGTSTSDTFICESCTDFDDFYI